MSSDGIITARLDSVWRRVAEPAWLEGWVPQPLAIEGGATEVVVQGSGPTVVLVPPLPGHKETFAACAQPLARAHRVVTFDLRTRYAPGSRMVQAVADLARVIDAHGGGPVVLVGHSLGGAIAQRFAIQHPDRVRGLVLSSSFAKVFTPMEGLVARWIEQPGVVGALRLLPDALGAPYVQRCAAYERWVFDWRCVGPVAELVRLGVRHLDLGAARAQIGLALEHDATRELATLATPTLILWGARDTAFARLAGERMLALVRHARRALSPQTGHLHPMSDPAWFAATIAEFVRDLQ